ncbi:unnamed protein product [Adineta steineri]|nr:unnamed protein product [Adineta steineri]CAF3746874.1 unnamed protein product [Adineta steineri]CAF3769336.1 unnamed protein product [Adineta steineri]
MYSCARMLSRPLLLSNKEQNIKRNRQFSPSSGPGSCSIKNLPGQAVSPFSLHPNAGSVTPTLSSACSINPSLSKQHSQSSTVSLTPTNSHENVIL